MNVKKYISICFFFICVIMLYPQILRSQKPDALRSYNAGDYEQAIAICKTEITENLKNLDSYVVLSWSLLKVGDYKQAELWSTEGRRVSRYDHRLVEALGEAKYYLGENNDALTLFQEYISLVPNGARIGMVYYLTGEIYIRLGRYRHADIALTQAVLYESLNAEWWSRLGYARSMAKEYAFAIEAYNRAIKINPSLSDAVRGKTRAQSYL